MENAEACSSRPQVGPPKPPFQPILFQGEHELLPLRIQRLGPSALEWPHARIADGNERRI